MQKLVLVADGGRAQFFMARGRKLHQCIHECHNEALGTHETIGRKDGRTEDGHFFDPHQEVQVTEKEAFARDLSHQVLKRMKEGDFESLILVASPKMLGMLRKKMEGAVEIERSLSLDATKMDHEKLESHIFD